MKRILLLILFFVALPGIVEAQWVKGFAFRNTSAYCGSDPANATWFRPHDGGGGDSYPTTRNSVTFGSTNQTISNREDNDNTRCSIGLAGRSYMNNNAASSRRHQIDLPAAGVYDIKLSSQSLFGQTDPKIFIYDNTTLLYTLSHSGALTGSQWLDINDTIHSSAANWAANNTARRLTFATTTLYVDTGWGDGAHTGSTSINYLEISQVSSTSGSLTTLKVSGTH